MEADVQRRAKEIHLPLWRRLGWRLGVSFLLLTALGILISGLLQYRAQDHLLRQSLGGLLLNIARTGALLVDGDLHQGVVDSGRNDTAEYARLRSQLARIQETNQLTDPVYTLSHVQGEMARFAVISNGRESVGKEYRLAVPIQPILRRVLDQGVGAYTDIYTNEHGTWISGFAPIRDASGRTVAALDVDFRADVYLGELAGVRRGLYLHSLAAAVLALGAGLLLARHITRPLAQLTSLARSVVEGDLSGRVRIGARDETGMLGNVLYLMIDRLQVSHKSMVDVLVRALEARGAEPGSLSRLASAALFVGENLGLSPTQREALELGALLHDIGKIRTPEAILQKPAPLTDAEREVIRRHPTLGTDILESVPLLTPALDVVGNHHERYDGTGYPNRLSAATIPLTARIFAVVDALFAMTHDRPYRSARSADEALNEIRREAGKQFDPRVVEAVLKVPTDRWAEILDGRQAPEMTTVG
jgi:putative nucleotidyltransferase with HDIG domain